MSFAYIPSGFPTVPTGKVLKEGGLISEEWANFFDQIRLFMQVNFSKEGLVMPSLTSAEIALLTNAQNGTMVYNTTTNKAMVKENGSFVNLV